MTCVVQVQEVTDGAHPAWVPLRLLVGKVASSAVPGERHCKETQGFTGRRSGKQGEGNGKSI